MKRSSRSDSVVAANHVRAAILAFALGGTLNHLAIAQVNTPTVPSAVVPVAPVPDRAVAPPGLQRFTIRQDTFVEREEFLKRRAASQVTAIPRVVPPLPEQAINPLGVPGQQATQ